jgi:hypothetical protein
LIQIPERIGGVSRADPMRRFAFEMSFTQAGSTHHGARRWVPRCGYNPLTSQENYDREHKHGHYEYEPIHVVVFKPSGEVQHYNDDGDEIKQPEQDLCHYVVPLIPLYYAS